MSQNVIPANSESTKIKYKIPEYAKDFRKEWLYIKGINKKCGDILSKIYIYCNDYVYVDKYLFNSNKINNIMCYIKKFLEHQERGRLKDISCFYFKYFDANYIGSLKEKMYEYYYINVFTMNIDHEQKFLNFADFILYIGYTGFHDFFELISLINDKVKKEEPTFNLS